MTTLEMFAAPTPGTFDTIDPPHLLGGIKMAVIDKDENPNRVLECDATWSIDVEWTLSGKVAPALGGEWTIHTYLESMGPGPENEVFPTVVVPVNAAPPMTPRTWRQKLDISRTPPAGVYKLVTVVLYSNMGKKLPMAGFTEGPLVEFYEAS